VNKLDEFGRPQYTIKGAAEKAVEILTKYQPNGHSLTVNEKIVIEVLTKAIKENGSQASN